MIYTVTLNPTIDRTLTIDRFRVGGTFKASHSDLLPAGKGINVARVIATLGVPVTALGLVGEHDTGAFATALAETGIENRLWPVPGATRISVTILDPTDGTETHLREQGSPPSADSLAQVETALEDVRPGDWVVFAGSLPPNAPVDTYARLIRLCIRQGAQAMLDASGPPLLSGVDARPTLLKPNLFELWQVDRGRAAVTTEVDLSALSVTDILVAARRVQERGIERVVVSMGERGALGLDRTGRAWHAWTTLDRPAVTAVGSGDALAAGLVVSLAQKDPLPGALRLGVACGAANTLVAGAGRCRGNDVERLAMRARVEELGQG